MRRSTPFLAVLLSLGLSAARLASADGASYKMVVHSSRSATSLSRARVADYLLKRASTWPDGTAVAVVDLSATSPTRWSLSRDVLGQSTDMVVHYWQRQVFSGRATPPPVKSEEEALALVAAMPGAIGYVGLDTPLPPGVKLLKLTD